MLGPRPSAPSLLVLLALLLSGPSCDRVLGDRAEASVAPAPVPMQPVAPQPVGPVAPAPAEPPAPSAAGQTLELPGLGSITINLPGLAGSPAGAAGPTAPAEARAPAVAPEPPPPHGVTPLGSLTTAFMQAETRAIHLALVAALPEAQRSRVSGIPLDIVNEPVEPNAAAACAPGSRAPVMVITTAMIVLAGGIAETRAFDELGGTSTYESYARQAVAELRGRRPVTGVPPGLVSGPLARDPRKLARERQLFQEQIAFIVGHELSHHHRGHTSCVGSGEAARASGEELARIASSAIPTFTQPLEVEADTWAVHTVLAAGNGRPGGSWGEQGGLLNLEFFGRLRELGGADVLAVFLGTHPMPQLRRPIIELAARQWSPGRWPPSALGEGIPLPGGGTFPLQIPGLTNP